MIEERHAVRIEAATTPPEGLPHRTGQQVAEDIGGRYLLRYLLPDQIGQFTLGSQRLHYVTPTPYAPEDTVSFLALPKPGHARAYVLILDPARIADIRGPQWIAGARGIQYILPDGFPQEAIVGAGAGNAWEIEVR